MTRQLVTIQEISEIKPIAGADKIVQAKVLGWNIVVRKDEFKVGDLCLYFEIDSLLPDKPCFEFVKRGSTKASALRLKTLKLRGVISQGLALPIDILKYFEIENPSLGDDITEAIGVKKWEPPQSSGRQNLLAKGNFPFYVPKTDEPRIQSNPKLLEEMKGLQVYSTVKLDGCSATFINKDGEYSVCSRNLSLQSLAEKQTKVEKLKADGHDVYEPKADQWWNISDKLGLKEKLQSKGNFAIQGELCGPTIQKNKLGLKNNELYVFNVYDIDQQKYLNYVEFVEFVEDLDLKVAPLIKIFTLNHSIEDLLEMAEGKYDSGKEREGIVIRPVVEQYSNIIKSRMSFKVISNKFLLASGE